MEIRPTLFLTFTLTLSISYTSPLSAGISDLFGLLKSDSEQSQEKTYTKGNAESNNQVEPGASEDSIVIDGVKYTYANSGCKGGAKSKYICTVLFEKGTYGELAISSKNFDYFKKLNNLPSSIKPETEAPLFTFFALDLRE